MKIEVKEVVLATHFWKDCPFKEVAFLKNEHHHNFHYIVSCDVKHSDRAIEFLMLRLFIKRFLRYNYKVQHDIVRFEGRSCEMLATDLTAALIEHFGAANWKVSVSEDNVMRGGEW